MRHAIAAMNTANTGAFTRPTTSAESGSTSCRRSMKACGGASSSQPVTASARDTANIADEDEERQRDCDGDEPRDHENLDRR